MQPEAESFVVAIRPEDITAHLFRPTNSTLNVLEGTVLDVTDQGPLVAVMFDAKLRLQAVLTKSVFLESDFEVGQKAGLSFKAEAVRVIEETNSKK
jgi:ABC-type Fe3+/spermidine/putrescine transport system ATPase subunit